VQQRDYGKYQWMLNLDHYLVTLSRKPGALHGSQALSQAPGAVRTVYNTWFTKTPREFIELLLYCQQNQVDHERLLETAIYVGGLCPDQVSAEKIIAVLGNQKVADETGQSEEYESEIERYSNCQLEEITRLMSLNTEEPA